MKAINYYYKQIMHVFLVFKVLLEKRLQTLIFIWEKLKYLLKIKKCKFGI